MLGLNEKDMRVIERAMGMMLVSVDVEDDAKRGETVQKALLMIDGTFEGAEKRKEEEGKKFVEALTKGWIANPPWEKGPKADADSVSLFGNPGEKGEDAGSCL